MRLTYLAVGDPLLGQVWQYKTLDGVEAIEQKLQDSFFLMDKLNVTDVIDTLYIGLDELGALTLPNTGVNGSVWPMIRRMECYRTQLQRFENMELLLEIELPTVVTDMNRQRYTQLVLDVIAMFPWVKRWQLMTMPEMLDSAGMLRCSSINYVRMFRAIAEEVHTNYPNVEIGGPGILQGITDYVNSEYADAEEQVWHTGWLAEATGELYSVDPEYDDVGPLGLLDLVDFFAFQGRQNFQELNYTIYQDIIKKMRAGLVTQAQRSGVNFNVPFLSTYQGHFADKGNYTDMQLQAYRDLREYANAWAVNVVPFKTQLVDEFFDEENPDAVKNVYGIVYYYLGNDRKPAWMQYQFLLTVLQEFTKLPPSILSVRNKRPHEEDPNLAYIMLMTDDEAKLATVIFPKTERDVLSAKAVPQRVALKAGLNRKFYLPDGNSGVLTEPVDVVLKNYDFVVVIEVLDDGLEVTEDLYNDVTHRLAFYKRYTDELLSMLPSTYPREAFDTGVYNMLRTVALELGDGAMEKEILRDNYYLATAHGDMIYNNFGALVDLPRRATWTDDEYRRIVGGLIEALLRGATKASVQRAVSLFTDLEVHVYEMFKDYEHAGLSREQSFDAQYAFTVEVHKPIDAKLNVDMVTADARMAADITRPAHTVPIVMIVLTGDEDYKDWYDERQGRPFAEADDALFLPTIRLSGNQFGWKANGYELVFRTANTTDQQPQWPKANGVLPLGPRHTLFAVDHNDISVEWTENAPRPTEQLLVEPVIEAEEVVGHPTEEMTREPIIIAREQKFGTRIWPSTLRTLGGLPSGLDLRVNQAPVGFGYILNDDKNWLRLSAAFEETVSKQILDDVTLDVAVTMTDEVVSKPTDDEMVMSISTEFAEQRFGYVVDDFSLMTNGRAVNMHRAAVRYKLADDMNMRLYRVAADGTEETVSEHTEF